MAALGFVTTIVSFALPPLAQYQRLLIIFAVIAIGTFVIARRWLRVLSGTLVVAAAVTWLAVPVLSQPSPEQAQVTQLMSDTKHANIWVGRDPVMYTPSSKYIVDHFSAFDPSRAHHWDELKVTKAASPLALVENGAPWIGDGVETAGRVKVAQPSNGAYIVQIAPLPSVVTSIPLVKQRLTDRVGDKNAQLLLSGTTPMTDPDPQYGIYCLVILGPGQTLQQDDAVVLKGALIAYGQTSRTDGHLENIAYIVASSIRSLDDQSK